jgi:DNA transformation protein and related proteins
MSDFIEYLHEVFALFGPITTCRMFGAHGIYRDGLMFGLYAQGRLYLKTDAHNLAQFTAEHCEPFRFVQRGKQVQLSYWSAPDFILDDRELAAAWAHSAYEAAMRAQEAKDRHASAPPWHKA